MKFIKHEQALALADNTDRYATLIDHAHGDIGLYRPSGIDSQSPHQRDEAYIVASGTGTFVCGDTVTICGPGDVLYVPAQVEHRFENFSDDFAVWVVFFGPRPAASS
jgi:mannose-6-phosphate isomerase-like protein (cupin superfamily)